MFTFLCKAHHKQLAKESAARLEQRTLSISFSCVIVLVIGSLSYGLYIGSDVVITNGIFSLFSLVGSGLNLAAAKLVAKPADNRFQYGYWHVEPLVLSFNGLLLCCISFYALVNSIENIRTGGNVVDPNDVILFGLVSGILCGIVWLFEYIVACRTQSSLVRNDSREWLVDFLFSMVTLLGFWSLRWLEEPWYSYWARYADSILIIVMVLLLIPFPIRVVVNNIREILLMTAGEDPVSLHTGEEMERIQKDYPGIISYSSHVVKVGRSHFVEVNILTDSNFPLQSVAKQDYLRKRLWKACNEGTTELWLAVCITEEEQWS